MGKDISSRGVTDVIFIFTGLHCQDVLRGDCKVQDRRKTHLEAITLT